MLPIATRLLTQRLNEVDAQITRVMLLKPQGNNQHIWREDVQKLQSIRREVLRELEVLDTV
jgi:hypothetical protein